MYRLKAKVPINYFSLSSGGQQWRPSDPVEELEERSLLSSFRRKRNITGTHTHTHTHTTHTGTFVVARRLIIRPS